MSDRHSVRQPVPEIKFPIFQAQALELLRRRLVRDSELDDDATLAHVLVVVDSRH